MTNKCSLCASKNKRQYYKIGAGHTSALCRRHEQYRRVPMVKTGSGLHKMQYRWRLFPAATEIWLCFNEPVLAADEDSSIVFTP